MDRNCPVCDYEGDFIEDRPDVDASKVIFLFECPECHSKFGDRYSLWFEEREVYENNKED